MTIKCICCAAQVHHHKSRLQAISAANEKKNKKKKQKKLRDYINIALTTGAISASYFLFCCQHKHNDTAT